MSRLFWIVLGMLVCSSIVWAEVPSSRPAASFSPQKVPSSASPQKKKSKQLEQDLAFLQGAWRCPLVMLKRDVGIAIEKGGVRISVQKNQPFELRWIEGHSLGNGAGEFLMGHSKKSRSQPKMTQYVYMILTFQRKDDDSVRFTVYETSAMYARDGRWKDRSLRRLGSNIPQRCVRQQTFSTIQKYPIEIKEKDLQFCRGVVKGQRDALRSWILLRSGCQREMCLLLAWQSLFERMSSCLELRGYYPYPFLYEQGNQQRAFGGLWVR